MDETSRLKLKVGQHEFEAEGPADIVQAQFQAWKDLIASAPLYPSPSPQIETTPERNQVVTNGGEQELASIDTSLGKIMRTDGRIISLTARPKNVEDAILLILYGQRTLRQNDAVTGNEVMEGLSTTGGLAVSRVDRLLEKIDSDGDVIVMGEHRKKRYRLTNAGLSKARQLANDLLAIVA